MRWSRSPQWFYFLIRKCNLDVCHLDAYRIFPESPFTLTCGNSSALCTFSASSLETILIVTSCSYFLHRCIFSHFTYLKSGRILFSLHLFTPQCAGFLSFLSASLCPWLSFPKTNKVRSGENTEVPIESVSKGKQIWESRCRLNEISSLTVWVGGWKSIPVI